MTTMERHIRKGLEQMKIVFDHLQERRGVAHTVQFDQAGYPLEIKVFRQDGAILIFQPFTKNITWMVKLPGHPGSEWKSEGYNYDNYKWWKRRAQDIIDVFLGQHELIDVEIKRAIEHLSYTQPDHQHIIGTGALRSHHILKAYNILKNVVQRMNLDPKTDPMDRL